MGSSRTLCSSLIEALPGGDLLLSLAISLAELEFGVIAPEVLDARGSAEATTNQDAHPAPAVLLAQANQCSPPATAE